MPLFICRKMASAITLFETYKIGRHIGKKPKLLQTVNTLPKDRPSQIFLGGPQSSNLKADEADMEACNQFVLKNNLKVFVHSQYIINLATRTEDDKWHIELLKKNLTIADKAGFEGVVVHVGKSVKLDKKLALENMRKNIDDCLETATELCPLLIETPAGQGTELLTKPEDFITFMSHYKENNNIKICLDTCHVYAAGCEPNKYLEKIKEANLIDKLALVHFNDSKEGCGCCKDRHEVPGEGKIGFEKMEEFAIACSELGVPMVFE